MKTQKKDHWMSNQSHVPDIHTKIYAQKVMKFGRPRVKEPPPPPFAKIKVSASKECYLCPS